MNIFGFIFEKIQIWSKNPKISFRQLKLTLAEGGYSFKKRKKKCLGGNKNVNVAFRCVVVQSKPYLWHQKMYYTLIVCCSYMSYLYILNQCTNYYTFIV